MFGAPRWLPGVKWLETIPYGKVFFNLVGPGSSGSLSKKGGWTSLPLPICRQQHHHHYHYHHCSPTIAVLGRSLLYMDTERSARVLELRRRLVASPAALSACCTFVARHFQGSPRPGVYQCLMPSAFLEEAAAGSDRRLLRLNAKLTAVFEPHTSAEGIPGLPPIHAKR